MSPQKEICQLCGAEWPRTALVRELNPEQTPAGKNLLLYSSYDSAFWTMSTLSDASDISWGCYGDRYRPRVAEDSTTEARGSQTWEGDGGGTAATGVLRSHTSSVDISGFTNACFSCYVGPYHSYTTTAGQTLTTVAMGFCNSDGSTLYQQKSYSSVLGARLCWFSSAVSGLDSGIDTSAAYVYVSVTIPNGSASNRVWIDHLCLEDSTKPGQYRPVTTGTAVNQTSNEVRWKIPILCPDCAGEGNLKPSERYGRFRIADVPAIRNKIESL